ncbi:uncharacterized protein EDB91DRAFT_1085188 [Suillus paluster]|uniref:uncharacterized protein n=1 Tax=Suillus paluster TaxID=48578 RepID=UPI001B85DD1A|nr:uncharacterized protein EDB91DRAFT_1085188 [Suillus paluster]KAG1731068.1 hypothetical protein EDB91DRAFT_1085188 [Suillus paluster]
MLIINNTFYGCIAGGSAHLGFAWGNLCVDIPDCVLLGDFYMNVTATTLCCNELGGKMFSANSSYGCAFVQNQFPATIQSVEAWRHCSTAPYECEIPSPSSNYTGLSPGDISRGVGTSGSGVGGSLMIGMLVLGVMAQMALTT